MMADSGDEDDDNDDDDNGDDDDYDDDENCPSGCRCSPRVVQCSDMGKNTHSLKHIWIHVTVNLSYIHGN